jgi:ribonuclease HI
MHSMYFDGASRGNPGPASFGGVIYDEDKYEMINYKKKIGVETNNFAEYSGLLAGLKVCIQYNIRKINVFGDSKLAVEQVNGNWKVKSANIKPLYDEIMSLVTRENFDKITFQHVKRNLNKRADELANLALDEE